MITAAASAPAFLRAAFVGRAITAAGPSGARTIGGVAVPYDVMGTVADGRQVVFERGSIDAAARPVLLRDHDRARPIGRVVDAADLGDRIDATARITPGTAAGDDVMVLAADGVPLMFSVGAVPLDADYDADGVLHVHAADWQELSVLTFGAFGGATVDRVAATQPGGTMPPDVLDLEAVTPEDPDAPAVPDPDVPDPDAEPNDDIEPDQPADGVAAVPVLAGAGRASLPGARRGRPARHPYASVDLVHVARLIAAASQDPTRFGPTLTRVMTSPGARTGAIEAALADVTLVGTNNVGPAFRPTYQAELVEIVSHGSPAVDMLRQQDLQRGDYPNVTFNAWTKRPIVAVQTAEKQPINSVAVAIGPTSVPVSTFATGNDISQQLLDFGSPSFVEDYIRAAGVDYAEKINLYVTTTLLAGAVDVPTAVGDDLPAIIAKLFAGLDPTKVPAGRMGMLVSWDLGVGAMGIQGADNTPVFWDGRINFGSYMPSAEMGGLTITVDTTLPARTAILLLTNAASWWDLPGTPFSLRAINVGQLGLDIAVYGYGACGIQFPGAVVKTTVPLT
jgi:hypothetical protein